MRRIRYSVAASLDGYIAGPNGEYDWIPMDPDIDFGALINEFDTVFVGRKTFAVMGQHGEPGPINGLETYVFSRTLPAHSYADTGLTVLGADALENARALRTQTGKDIWLFGGGELFRSLADANLVDTVEVAVVPIMLGGGIPLAPAARVPLTLTKHQQYPKTGIVALTYAVNQNEHSA